MKQDELKKAVAQEALKYVNKDSIIGIGTGSTVNFFIEALAKQKISIEGAVSSSQASTEKLKAWHIPVVDLNSVNELSVYIDGADEFNEHHYLIKGGGGALTREKIVATVAKKFVCIADQTKEVAILGGKHPVPLEVIPMARSYVARQMIKLGGDPVYREKFITDNGNVILDVHNLKILDPVEWEKKLKCIAGVVENGLFASRPADIILCATDHGIKAI